jgi:fucose permease
MIRFQQLLPAFIGFFIVGTIIGLLIDGIGLGIILGLIIGAVATAIFWQFAQEGSFSPLAGSTVGPPA